MTGAICDLVGPLSKSEQRQIRHRRGCRGHSFMKLVIGSENHDLCIHLACPNCERHYCIAPQFGQADRVMEMKNVPWWYRKKIRQMAAKASGRQRK